MGLFFSPSVVGFFDSEIHGDAMPADAVPITSKRHEKLLLAQSEGATITADSGGRPFARWPSAKESRAAVLARIKGEAARRIELVSPTWRQLNDWREPSEAGAARFRQVDAIRAASDRIGELLDETRAADLGAFLIENSPLWPEFE